MQQNEKFIRALGVNSGFSLKLGKVLENSENVFPAVHTQRVTVDSIKPFRHLISEDTIGMFFFY